MALVVVVSGSRRLAAVVGLVARLFAASPVVGTGPGPWVVQRIRETIAPELDYYIPHAHNVIAQTLAELGLVGAVAGLALGAYVIWLVRDGLGDEVPCR